MILTMDHELIWIKICTQRNTFAFLEYVSTWKDFLPGKFPAKSLLQHEVNSLRKPRFSSVQHKMVRYTSRNMTAVYMDEQIS